MKKNIALLLMAILLLTSCNQASQSPTASETTAPTSTLAPADTTVPTQTQAATSVPTSLPTATAANPTSIPTPSPATPTTLPSPTATAVSSATDPSLSLGQPIWENDSNWAGFFQGNINSEVKIVHSNGILVLTSLKSDGFYGWSVGSTTGKDFYLEGTFSVAECIGSDRYGLVFRAPDSKEGYFFGITCDGQYSLHAWTTDSKTDTFVTSWTPSADILTGSNQTNLLGVLVKGDQYSLYINGKLVGTVTSDQFLTEGSFGAFISASTTTDFTVNLQSLKLWNLSS